MKNVSAKVLYKHLIFSCLLCSTIVSAKTEPNQLPLFSVEQLEYRGAFKLPANTLGESEANWANGTIAYNHRNHSLFLVGHDQHQAIAEFAIPELKIDENLDALNTASVIQAFTRIFPKVKSNTDGQDMITGMYYHFGRLIINTINYYDASATARNTTLVIKDASRLSEAKDLDFYALEYAARASGWISSVPEEWRTVFNADTLVGNGNGRPINGRLSIGPSAFTTNIRTIINADIKNGHIPLTPLQFYTLQQPLSNDLLNENKNNKLLTELSKPVYGFIIPGTRTYMVIGSSGGHKSGIGYKLEHETGSCAGFCANNPHDMSNYYWLWDINHWLEVLSGKLHYSEVKPYQFGEIILFYEKSTGFKPITGASYDNSKDLLWISLAGTDINREKYRNMPVIMAYSLKILKSD